MASDTGRFVVAVAAVIVRRGDKGEPGVLAMQRSQHKNAGPGLWETLSGRLEPGEEPLDAVEREITEECGLNVLVDPRPLTSYSAERLGEPMVVIVYLAHYLSGEVTLSDEHDAFAWLSADAFAERSSLDELVVAARQAVKLIKGD